MKKILGFIVIILFFSYFAGGDDEGPGEPTTVIQSEAISSPVVQQQAETKPQPGTKIEVDIMQVANKGLAEAEKVLGKPKEFAPMESAVQPGTSRLLNSTRVKSNVGGYKKGNLDIEVIFMEGEASRISILFPSNITDYKEAFSMIGLPVDIEPTEPTNFNAGMFHMWSKGLMPGLYEVRAYTKDDGTLDYVYIIGDDKYR